MINKATLFSADIEIHSLIQRMLIGAVIGFLLISVFVFGLDNPNPAWPEHWRIRPLIITPLAGAFGILSFYLSDVLKPSGEWANLFISIISIILFLIALWLGTVLGLAGTMWN
jgi:hypothetical protein